MKIDFEIKGLDRINSKLAKHPERLAKAAFDQLRSEARILCGQLAKETGPAGFGESSRRRVAKIIERDMRRLFPENQLNAKSAGGIYNLLKSEFGEEVADAFWYQYKSGNTEVAEKFVRKRGLPRGVDLAKYDARRKQKGGVGRDPIALATQGRVESAIRKKQKRVGMAKAAWYQAARAVGGRLRTQSATSGKVVATFPKWVISAGRGLRLGGASLRQGPRPRVVIFSGARHGKSAIPSGVLARATAGASRRLARAAQFAAAAENKKRFKS